MKKLLKLVYSNKFFAILTLFLQLVYILAFVIGVFRDVRPYHVVSYAISTILILFEVNRHEESAYKITWIMLISLVPFFGWFFYIYTHTGVISKNILKAQAAAEKKFLSYRNNDDAIIDEMDKAGYNTSLAKYLTRTNRNSVYKNTEVKYYPLGDDLFPDMFAELEKAKNFILIEFFIINASDELWKRTEDILIRKAAEGVKVKLLYDGMGCMGIVPKNYDRYLRKKGIDCRIFSPVQPLLSTYQNNRDHRKIVVIDGRCAFSGGINLADEYVNKKNRFGHWKDNGYRLTGDGVAGFTKMFLTMWCTVNETDSVDYGKLIEASAEYSKHTASGYVIPFGDVPMDNRPVGRNAYADILNAAKKYVHIMTPYFVIDETIYSAMSYAVMRGVNVKIILPGIPDKRIPYCLARSYYRDLLDIGVEVYEYTPGFVHAKTTVSDNRRAIIGTINYDYRSLYLHYECASYLVDVPQIRDMETDIIATLAQCRRITRREYDALPWFYRFAGRVLRFIATMI